jgi:hypothetical protein
VTTKTWPEHTSMLPMKDWLAGLRDGQSAEPAGPCNVQPAGPVPGGPGYAVPASYGFGAPANPRHAEAASYARATAAEPGYAVPADYGYARAAADAARPQAPDGPVAPPAPAVTVAPSAPAVTVAPAATAAPAFPARSAAPTTPAGPAGAAVRAMIGDQLRMPAMWCEMGSCRSRHADPAALGEADARARAIDAGWRFDAVGRLACPQCQQSNPGFWASCPVAVRDPDTTLASTVPMPAVPGGGITRGAWLRRGRAPGRAARGYPRPDWRRWNGTTITQPMRPVPAGRRAERPASASIPAVGC